MKKILFIVPLLALVLSVSGQSILRNSATTNTEPNLITFIESITINPTNGITAAQSTNIANAMIAAVAPLTNGDGRALFFSNSVAIPSLGGGYAGGLYVVPDSGGRITSLTNPAAYQAMRANADSDAFEWFTPVTSEDITNTTSALALNYVATSNGRGTNATFYLDSGAWFLAEPTTGIRFLGYDNSAWFGGTDALISEVPYTNTVGIGGNGQYLYALSGSGITSGSISNAAIADATITSNKLAFAVATPTDVTNAVTGHFTTVAPLTNNETRSVTFLNSLFTIGDSTGSNVINLSGDQGFIGAGPAGFVFQDTTSSIHVPGGVAFSGTNIESATIPSNRLAFSVATPTQVSDATNAANILAITAQQTNYATLIAMLGPLTNGLGGGGTGGTYSWTNDVAANEFQLTDVSTIMGTATGPTAGTLILTSDPTSASTIHLYGPTGGFGAYYSAAQHIFYGPVNMTNVSGALDVAGNLTATGTSNYVAALHTDTFSPDELDVTTLYATNAILAGKSNALLGLTVEGAFTNVALVGASYSGNTLTVTGPLKTKDFGVVGYSTLTAATNAADQAANLQSAFDVVSTLNGATLEFENGLYYYIGTNISVKGENITVAGNGATILRDNHTLLALDESNTPFSAFNVVVKAGDGTDYDSDWSKNIRFRDLRFLNIGSTSGLSSDGGYFTNLNGVTVTYNRRQNKQINRGASIAVDYGRNITVDNCTFSGVGVAVVCNSASVTNSEMVLLSSVNVQNCEIRDWGHVGISPGQDSVIKNCVFIQTSPRLNQENITATLGTSHAIYVSGAKPNVLVDGCSFFGVRYYGVQWYTASAGSVNGRVMNSYFNDCFKVGTVSTASPLNHDGFIFANNSVTNCGRLELGTSTTGHTNESFIVSGNRFVLQNTNGTDYHVYVSSGTVLLQDNLFSGSPNSHVSVQGATLVSFRSKNNVYEHNTNSPAYLSTTGVRLATTATNALFEFVGDSFHSYYGISAAPSDRPYRTMTIRNCLFDCSGRGILLPNGFTATANTFLINPIGYAFAPQGSTSVYPSYFVGNLFMTTPGASAGALMNSTSNATNQLVCANNYFGPGVSPAVYTDADRMARIKMLGSWDNNIYGSNVVSALGTYGNNQFTTNRAVIAPNFLLRSQLWPTNAAFTFGLPININRTNYETCVVLVTNSTAAAVVITPPAAVIASGTWYCTNVTEFTFRHYGGMWTNAVALPLW